MGRGGLIARAGLGHGRRSVCVLWQEEQPVFFGLDELGDLVLYLGGWEVVRVDLDRSWDLAAGVANLDLDSRVWLVCLEPRDRKSNRVRDESTSPLRGPSLDHRAPLSSR